MADAAYALIALALITYVCSAGAAFGAVVWDAFASGPRRRQQRALIEQAIAPIWEANHVWLIFAIVTLFTAFPRAFAAISIAFHVPMTLFLLGIVFRGSAFVFRSAQAPGRWGFAFSIASIVSPLLLGAMVGGIASGQVRVLAGSGFTTGGYFAPWLSLFAIAVAVLALASCAFLAAVYLANEAKTAALAEDFRVRALLSAAAVSVIAPITLVLSKNGAPEIWAGLTTRTWGWPLHLAAIGVSLGVLLALLRRRYRRARLFAILEVALVVAGWALAQYPYLLVPDITVHNSAASEQTLKTVAVIIGGGSVVLVPSLVKLFRVFKAPGVER